ncbi:MAG: DUF4256 domain-containing protein [Saprospiraceae bacterium]|nr:DUF4256 domain-containing protein [Saprospiraceae bacterium]
MSKKSISSEQKNELLKTLQLRFEKNMKRHNGIEWSAVQTKLEALESIEKLWTLHEMEATGGEPDVVFYDEETNEYHFYDCSPESPKGRRSLCYDKAAWDSRKEYKPENNALDVATTMGIEILTEVDYRYLQQLGNFDSKTSSWLKTPESIRKNGGAIFGDYRFGSVFIYHNGAESYYAARGFRGFVKV